jgi:copper chaperone CopZ
MLKLKVEGMSCAHCVGRIRQALSGLVPESAVDVELSRGEISLATDLDPVAIIAALEAAGYGATLA